MSLQEQFDEAMFEFSTGHGDAAIGRLKAILAEAPDFFDAQLGLGALREKMKKHDPFYP